MEAMNEYDRASEVKAFDETKAGVKGLVDAGVAKIPRIFIHEQSRTQLVNNNNNPPAPKNPSLKIPLIDFQGLNDLDESAKIIEQVGKACEEWGFFQIISHGIPTSVLDEVIDGIRRFHEQDLEAKKEFFSRDYSRKVLYHTNYDLYKSKAACWRDTLTLIMAPRPPAPQQLPQVCRDIMLRYTDEIMRLGIIIYELLSKALGLNPNHLKEMGCADGVFVPCHYYPACPEPELTIGLASHADISFITLLLQDQIGGLQVLHDNHWVDVTPIPGALVCNVGDLLKLISNDKFVSAYHRVVNKTVGPRISVPYIFRSHLEPENSSRLSVGPRISVPYIFRSHLEPENSSRLYGPIKELLSKENPPRYREITVKEITNQKYSKKSELVNALEQFKL